MRKFYQLSIINLLVISFSLGVVNLANASSVKPSSSKNFDFYLLATQWIPGWCKVGTGQSGAQLDKGRACLSKMWLNHLMYHGFWPQNYNGTYPSACAKVTAIESSHLTFNNPYTNYLLNSKEFIYHEWAKHGSCSTYYNSTEFKSKYNESIYYSHVNNYFRDSLKMYAAIKLPAIPKRITRHDLLSLIHRNNNNIPKHSIAIMCAVKDKGAYLTGLWFCVTKSSPYKYSKCPQSILKDTCKSSKLYTR